ncbi:MAG: tRNA uridine-5-carboxymethylaminomethyl(34) synthesis GTPase MnmE [Fibrobacteraceae bacterium]|nr:tRNA uridine-5-carboxymethylaminomethyl(34) synthesis GTPase MnmE [Fibrobacteraceae bacterium]
MDNKTIVAPMTPAGVSAVAALRVSGSMVRALIESLFNCKNPKPRQAALATAKNPQTGAIIDSLLYLFFEGPNSYTGEDTLELYPHGNPLIVRELLQAIREFPNCRLAEPGEFTRRAFLNGKMDLIQAESVADVIHSANKAELSNAHRLLGGALSVKIKDLHHKVMDMSARLELDTDFAEEEADPDYAGWEDKFISIGKSIESVLHSFHEKANLSKLPMAVLYGAPNAGKSSLVNALLGEDRILVSAIPGTTRDFVEVRLFLADGEIRLVDTAGIAEKATDDLDALSMKKSEEILKEADLKILLVDSTNPPPAKVIDQARETGALVVLSKADLESSLFKESEFLKVSAKSLVGLEELKTQMNSRLFQKKDNEEDLWITSERARDSLQEALAGVDRALALLRTNPAVELIAFEMQLVRRALQTVTGEISSEDILQSIFSGFCIGK